MYSLVSLSSTSDRVVDSVQILCITLLIMLGCGYSFDCNHNTLESWTKVNKLCAIDGHKIIHYIIMHSNFILEFVSIQLNLPYFLNNGRFG